MRKTCDSSKPLVDRVVERLAPTRRSVPNGFSQITRAFSLSPVSPSMSMTDGERRRRDRKVIQPARVAARSPCRPWRPRRASGCGSSGSATPKESRLRNVSHTGPRASWSRTRGRASRCVLAELVVGHRELRRRRTDDAVVRRAAGRSRPGGRGPGSSLRLARSPVAPKSTMTWSSGSWGTSLVHRDPFFVGLPAWTSNTRSNERRRRRPHSSRTG